MPQPDTPRVVPPGTAAKKQLYIKDLNPMMTKISILGRVQRVIPRGTMINSESEPTLCSSVIVQDSTGVMELALPDNVVDGHSADWRELILLAEGSVVRFYDISPIRWHASRSAVNPVHALLSKIPTRSIFACAKVGSSFTITSVDCVCIHNAGLFDTV